MVILIIILLLLFASGGFYGHGAGWYANNNPYAWGGTSLLGIFILVLIVAAITGRL